MILSKNYIPKHAVRRGQYSTEEKESLIMSMLDNENTWKSEVKELVEALDKFPLVALKNVAIAIKMISRGRKRD